MRAILLPLPRLALPPRPSRLKRRRFFGPTTPMPLRESRDPRGKRARRRGVDVCVYVRSTCAYACERERARASENERDRARVCVTSYVGGECVRAVRTRAPTRRCVGERARACVRGGARVSVSHLTTTRVIRATVATSEDDAVRVRRREYRRKSRWPTRGFIARRSRRPVAQNRFILSARSARRTR